MSQWLQIRRGNKDNNGGTKRNASEVFGKDWESYEKRGTIGNVLRVQPSHQPFQSNSPQHHQASNNTTFNPYKNPKPSSTRNNVPQPQQQPPHNPFMSEKDRDLLEPSTFASAMKNPEPTVKIPTEEPLNEEQRLVVESVLSGYSTFFTGPAGSGKSHVLSSILRLNEESDNKRKIVVTATTGLAACNVSGVTIHSFSGIGIDSLALDKMVARVMGNSFSKKRWRECDCLVIDEVSMMSAKFLDNLNFIASRVRGDRRVFGGIQLVLCGDFFQLPPIDLKESGFAFEAKCWSKVITSSIVLKKIFRQNGDSQLMTILNEARLGELSQKSEEILYEHGKQNKKETGEEFEIKPTQLECRNMQVDRANMLELHKLKGDEVTFTSKDRTMSKVYENLLKNYQAPEKLVLKTGAQVILLKNLEPESGLVNGSRGVIMDFEPHPSPINDLPREFKKRALPVVLFDNGIKRIIEPAEWSNKLGDSTVCSRIQIPLRLAWALSVHKSQGMTIPYLTVNLAGVFEFGQAYVALSRATKLAQLKIVGFNVRSIRAHPKVKIFDSILNCSYKREQGNQVIKPINQECIKKAASVPPSHTNAPMNLTQEQLQRMEENRKRALEIQRKKKAAVLSKPKVIEIE